MKLIGVTSMKIEVWSDFVCPFCYVGKRRLEEALEKLQLSVEVEFKSFELDPAAEVEVDMNVYEMLAKKYGTSIAQAENMTKGIKEHGEQAGIEFDFDNSIPTNTFDAHRLAKFAALNGLDLKLTENLLNAHFVDGRHIGDKESLLFIAEDIGMDIKEAKEVLEGTRFSDEVRMDENEARQLGIQGVPFFVINRKYAISGAQPAEVFESTLKKIWEEEHGALPLQSVSGNSDLMCSDNGCEVEKEEK
jgi:predicted DsbA family dithiol-disulfide isomerase